MAQTAILDCFRGYLSLQKCLFYRPKQNVINS
nr:MAG TPA: hypothetical protein [Caudoviricetes sp.]